MIRLLGFLVGSAASIGLILVILGMPDIHLARSVIDDADLESVSRTVEAAKTDIEAVAQELLEEATEVVNDLPPADVPTEQAEPATQQADNPSPDMNDPVLEQATTETSQAQSDAFPPEHDGESRDDSSNNTVASNMANDAGQNEQRWHSFWNPFRSEIAANGFVGQLEKVTGLDYRVVKIKTGVYEVTFPYDTDTERRAKLAQIASATGLDLPES